jgi:hypothetical protein
MADMIRRTRTGRSLLPEHVFEASRRSDGWVAAAYELLVPVSRRRLPAAEANEPPPRVGDPGPPRLATTRAGCEEAAGRRIGA